ncbi:MAG: PAS domain-containing protein [Candidatus Izemoplasmatales bacterium]
MTPSPLFDPRRSAVLDRAVADVLDDPGADKSAAARRHRTAFDAATPFDVLGMTRFASVGSGGAEAILGEAGKLIHLFRNGLSVYPWNREVHPALVALRQENDDVLAAIRTLSQLFSALDDPASRRTLAEWIGRFEELERKFRKAELLLHPALDAHLPSPVPLKVMWMLHDEIRAARAELASALSAPDPDPANLSLLAGRFHYDVVGLTEKEELILYPAAATLLSPAEWYGIGKEAAGFGFAFGADPAVVETTAGAIPAGVFSVRTGTLGFDQLALVLDALPLEITFIDEHDVTRYYNGGKTKIFMRTPQILGRPVYNCHPEKSVPVVRGMLQSFKEGRRDAAELWIELKGRFVHIVYRALRDASGAYRGTIEIVQDLTHERSLTGTRETVDL